MVDFSIFKTSDKKFVGADNRVYLGELPIYLAHKDVPKIVACSGHFRLEEREGNILTFKTGDGYTQTIKSNVLTNPNSGEEICFVEYKGARIMLEASTYMHGGRRVTREEMESYRVYDGRTLSQYLEDKAKKKRQ